MAARAHWEDLLLLRLLLSVGLWNLLLLSWQAGRCLGLRRL